MARGDVQEPCLLKSAHFSQADFRGPFSPSQQPPGTSPAPHFSSLLPGQPLSLRFVSHRRLVSNEDGAPALTFHSGKQAHSAVFLGRQDWEIVRSEQKQHQREINTMGSVVFISLTSILSSDNTHIFGGNPSPPRY